MSIPVSYGDAEGPLGFPMLDAQAKALDELLRAHPDHEYGRALVIKATADLSPGERADISWLQTEAIDADREIVLASGFRDDVFKLNPVVTLNHNYWQPPVGKSMWRLRLREGDRRGIKAKTHYPERPAEWPADQEWPSDAAWSLIKSGLMNGKSIGFLTLKSHAPTDDEIKKRPELSKVRRIVDEWQLIEYAVTWMPCNPEAVVESTAKALTILGLEIPQRPVLDTVAPTITPHTPLAEIEKAITRRFEALNLPGLISRAVEEAYLRARGQVQSCSGG